MITDRDFLIGALALIAGLTTLTVQALKKILDEFKVKYSANLLAAIVSMILSIAVCVGYVLYNSLTFDIPTIITIVALTYLSFLASTVGFDKITQMIDQIKGVLL